MVRKFRLADSFVINASGDGYIDMKELKTVTMLLGTMLTKEELDDFMAEADAVSKLSSVQPMSKVLKSLRSFWLRQEPRVSLCLSVCPSGQSANSSYFWLISSSRFQNDFKIS